MISYEHFQLSNGLNVYLHEDKTTPMAVFNLIYNVGSKDEDENKTGFAHLFEHLMFGGSVNIPSYDEPLQKVGGQNNAFTSSDITNYYITLPVENLETAFWLESDRMLSLSFDPKVLEVQQKVVIEEFKQRYLNQPYGDVWLKLLPLSYQVHPYRWATIGKEIRHIEEATMTDVKDFFFSHYLPNNANLVIAGNVELKEVERLAKKWFGDIPSGKVKSRNLPVEPAQMNFREHETSSKVPLNAVYRTYHMQGRYQNKFHEADLVSDILGRSKSARLNEKLVKEKQLFNNINAYITATLDPGLLVIQGNLNQGVDMKEGIEALDEVLDDFCKEGISEQELEKVKNQSESSMLFGEVELLNRAMNLAFASNAGDPDYCNRDAQLIESINKEGLMEEAGKILKKENSNTLKYYSQN